MLFWYTPPLQSTLEGLAQAVDDLIRNTERMQESLDQQARQAVGALSEADRVRLELRLQAETIERDRLRSEELKEWLNQGNLCRESLEERQQELESRLKIHEEALHQGRVNGDDLEILNRLRDLEARLQTCAEALEQERLRGDRLEEAQQQERQRGDRLEEALRAEHLHREEIESRLREQGETLLRECLRNDELEKGLRQEHLYREGLENRINGREDHFQTQTESLEQERRRITEILQQERLCTIELEGRLREQVDSVQQLHEEQHSQEYDIANRLRNTEERVQRLQRELLENSRRVARLLEEARKRLPAPLDREQLQAFEQEDLHDLDPLYVAFEDALRGPREEIQARLKVYLPVLQKAKPDDGEFAVLDIGCGRGEWLDLLRQEGFPARGVDFNRSMVEECRQKQLDVESADALEYLSRIPDASLGAVTVFHMVEHLPFRVLIHLLDEVTRILQPGGVAIFETPNPNNFLVGSRNFYFDPTHRNPIPNETLRFLVESRGLCQVKVMPLNPCDPCNHVPEGKESSALVRRFNEYFYGAQDYAVIGRKV
jgi:O-antigen chain-terminating methyltransferase